MFQNPALKYTHNPFVLPSPGANCVLWLPGQDDPYSATIRDRSGNGNNGTIAGAIWTRLGSGIWVLNYDGVDDKTTVTDAASIQNIFDTGDGGAVEFWIRPETIGEGNNGNILNKGGIWAVSTAYVDGTTCRLVFGYTFSDTGGQWYTTARDINLNVWQHIVMDYAANDVTNNPVICVNGVSKNLTESVTPVGTRTTDAGSGLNIGNNAATTETFDGDIAIVRGYTAVRNVAGALQHFNQERHLFGV